MKQYYELKNGTDISYWGKSGQVGLIVRVLRTPAIHPVYTYNDAVEHILNPETIIGYWSIPMPLCNLLSEYYDLADYLVINKNQFTRTLEIK